MRSVFVLTKQTLTFPSVDQVDTTKCAIFHRTVITASNAGVKCRCGFSYYLETYIVHFN